MGAWLYPEGAPSARRYAVVALLVFLVTALSVGSAGAGGPKITGEWQLPAKDGPAELTLVVALEHGWHLNANDPDRPYLVPTTLEITPPEGTKIESIRYPDAAVHSLAFAPGTSLRLYEGTFSIRVKMAGALPLRFGATLSYQACNDEKCLPPTSLAVPYEAAK